MAITISGSGIVEANLADNAVTLAKMASGTDGEILTYDASGNPVAVSVGTDGQVLTSTGAGSPPAFEAAASGASVLLASGTISNVSTLDFTGLPSDTYIAYRFIMQNTSNTNGAGYIVMRKQANSSWHSGASDYAYTLEAFNISNGSREYGYGTTDKAYVSEYQSAGASASNGHKLDITIMPLSDDSAYIAWHGEQSGYVSTRHMFTTVRGFSHNGGSSEITGLQFWHTGGTWDNSGGDYVLLGIKKS